MKKHLIPFVIVFFTFLMLGCTLAPFVQAGGDGDQQTIKALLDKGQNVNQVDSGWTALMYASRNGHLDTVKLLIDNGADVNILTHMPPKTALSMAAYNKHADVIKLLLKNGADIDETLRMMEGAHTVWSQEETNYLRGFKK